MPMSGRCESEAGEGGSMAAKEYPYPARRETAATTSSWTVAVVSTCSTTRSGEMGSMSRRSSRAGATVR